MNTLFCNSLSPKFKIKERTAARKSFRIRLWEEIEGFEVEKMANDCVMLEGSRVCGGGGEEERENGNGIELSLELSIGGAYAKSKKSVAELEENGRSSGGSGELVDPLAKREIQALRRQEARKKREGKLKKVNWKETTNGYGYGYGSGSGNGNGNGNGGVNSDQEDSRVRVRVNGDGLMEPASKRGKNGDGFIGENQGPITVVPAQYTNGFVDFYGGMTCLGGIGGNEVKSEKCGFQLTTGGRSFRPYLGNRNCGKEGGAGNASVSPGRSSSAFSDYQNSNLLGGNTSDNGSNSSYSQAKVQQRKNVSAPPEQSEHSGSSKQTESTQAVHSSADSRANIAPSCIPVKPNEEPKSDNESSPVINNNLIPTTHNTDQQGGPLKETSEAVTSSRPQTESVTQQATVRPQMPCVSTTGNGPNGKTVMGFLYRYNKNEVSIVCVCHGSSFSPAEFVEHAGGIDITHPLKHITVIPSAFG